MARYLFVILLVATETQCSTSERGYWILNLLDYCPIVGTAKNTVEAAFSLSRGDISMAESKALEAAVGGVIDVTTFGIGSIAERIIIKGVEESVGKTVAENLAKQALKADSKAVVSTITKLTIRDYVKLTKPKPEPAEETTKKPSRRGEHVINNNVLKVFRQIVEEFVSQSFPGYTYQEFEFWLNPNRKVYQACNNPLPMSYRTAIQTELVAHVEGVYADANAVVYGIRIQFIKTIMVNYMKQISVVLNGGSPALLPTLERNIEVSVEEFLVGEYFVDPTALELWLQQGGTMTRFQDVKAQVIAMFRRLERHFNEGEIAEWVREINEAAFLISEHEEL